MSGGVGKRQRRHAHRADGASTHGRVGEARLAGAAPGRRPRGARAGAGADGVDPRRAAEVPRADHRRAGHSDEEDDGDEAPGRDGGRHHGRQ